MEGIQGAEEQQISLNINCKVCGEQSFELREGFYYCNECGTKQEQLRSVLVENTDKAGELPTTFRKTQKIQQEKKTSELNVTSWECYNYILRGFVEELISFGAKEELKLMTLQLWAAFLRRNQVAFFNKKHADLPKLSVGYRKLDAKVLYHHSLQKRAKRKKSRSDAGSILTSEASSRRSYRKSKRQLDESVYSQHSSLTNITSESGVSSSTSGASSRPIHLRFSNRARKQLKQIMNPNHLKKHEQDAFCELKCHSLRSKNVGVRKPDLEGTVINLRQIYALLAIALNLVEDDIQLSDLLRFVNEDRLSRKNIVKYFPENTHQDLHQTLKDMRFGANRVFEEKILREQIAYFSKTIQLRTYKIPNILALIQRYVTELNLPNDIYKYAERLVNFLPPTMRTRGPFIYPAYEARAMAYIIFILKLFFGLDGYKETVISMSSKNINNRISFIAESCSKENEKHPLLFVYSDWVDYIEMRKIIVSQYSRAFSKQFKQRQTVENWFKEIITEQKAQSEEEILPANQKAPERLAKINNMQTMFDELCSTLGTDSSKMNLDNISFEPSLTPAHTYMKKLLLLYSINKNNCFPIPEYMRVDHSQRTIAPHLKTSDLSNYLKEFDINLSVKLVTCSENRNFIGYFWSKADERRVEMFRADFDVNTTEWSNKIKSKPVVEPLGFKTELQPYHKRYLKEQRKKIKLRVKFATRLKDRTNEPDGTNAILEDDVRSMHSFNVFREDNMDALDNVNMDAPLRNMNSINLLKGIDDEENLNASFSEQNDNANIMDTIKSEENLSSSQNKVTFATSKMDYWLILGRPLSLFQYQGEDLERKFPRSFFWLLETCAQTLGVDWMLLYEQVLAIEIMFTYGVENLDKFTECLRLKYDFSEKELTSLISNFRNIW